MWQAPPALRLLGLSIGGLVLIHLALVVLVGSRSPRLAGKEWSVAAIYAAGVWGGPWAVCPSEFPPLLYGLACMFFLLALLNLLLFSLYEAKTDLRDRQTSWVLGMGIKRSKYIAGILAGGAAGLGLVIAVQGQGALLVLALLQLAMLSLLVALLLFPSTFRNHALYRTIGDGVFLLNFLFSNGAWPDAPNSCGPDPTQDNRDCVSFDPCSGVNQAPVITSTPPTEVDEMSNLSYTVVSKRKLLELVEGNYVSGWDDPRGHSPCSGCCPRAAE